MNFLPTLISAHSKKNTLGTIARGCTERTNERRSDGYVSRLAVNESGTLGL
jgi:hypothetical protein